MNSKHKNVAILEEIYTNLHAMEKYISDDMVLHTAEREIAGCTVKVVGKENVLNKEKQLIDDTGNSLIMEVESITANDYFGVVMGTIRAHKHNTQLAVPFCGLWKFSGKHIIEHWENAWDIKKLMAFLSQDIPD